ncbi:hypothetical protein DPMN_057867 [Dreissena polymorpha]|uniref:Uncharacterized protein n=1 Tax=Dreissena polymorpha TaxID=45954 RepID=A0A9D4HFD9_DREPO|nr:hypothetical protein DPMN_057867 [Dreissena polymorpha]
MFFQVVATEKEAVRVLNWGPGLLDTDMQARCRECADDAIRHNAIGTQKKNCPTPSSHETNVLSNFHENWAKKVTSTVFTWFQYTHIEKNAPPTGGHVFSPIPTIFKLVRAINKTKVLTNFHDDWAKIVTSRPKRENCHYIHIEKNAPPTGGHVFPPISTIFELDDWAKNVTSRLNKKTAPPTGGHVFQRIGTTFELGRDFIGTKLLTKFHEDGTRNVASRVFTSKC